MTVTNNEFMKSKILVEQVIEVNYTNMCNRVASLAMQIISSQNHITKTRKFVYSICIPSMV
jgi:hypothetical protein